MLKNFVMPIIAAVIIYFAIAFILTGISLNSRIGLSPFESDATIDLTTSMMTDRPVSDMIANQLGATIELTLVSLLVAAIFAPIIPILNRVKLAGCLAAIPVFVAGLLLIVFFAMQFRILPTAGYCNVSVNTRGCPPIWGRLEYLLMPVSSIVIVLLGRVCLHLKHNGDKHWYTNTLNVAIDAGTLLGSIMVIETVFALPGIGRLFIESSRRLDLPVMLACFLALTALAILIATIAQLILNAITHFSTPTPENLEDAPLFDEPAKQKRVEGPSLQEIIKHPSMILALILMAISLIVLPISQRISNVDLNDLDRESTNAEPSGEHPLGTDALGRDLLTRLAAGTSTSMAIALGVGIAATGIGFIAAIIFNYIPVLIPFVRGFAYGVSPLLLLAFLVPFYEFDLMFKILLLSILLSFPAAMWWLRIPTNPLKAPHQIIGVVFLMIAEALIIETMLSFLGLGVFPPEASLGNIMTDSQRALYTNQLFVVVAGLWIAILAWSLYMAAQPNLPTASD